MGTNYYYVEEIAPACPHCGREKELRHSHIGKKSAGWTFIWNKTLSDNVKRWLNILRTGGGYIEDEYDRRWTFEDFIITNIIRGEQSPLKDAAIVDPEHNFHDDDGFTFSLSEDFS